MNLLLSALAALPEYQCLITSVRADQPIAVTGVSQLNRAHFAAALVTDASRPALLLCQDDLAAQRLRSELSVFLERDVPILPSRELTLCDAAAVSHGWEQKRLRQLYDLARGATTVLIASLDAFCLHTMPKQVLFSCATHLKVGAAFSLDQLAGRLTQSGYARTSLVEGAGQFSIRGGILDVFSPAHDAPIRAEFFSDELDAMGFFDPVTQRRTENTAEAVILPVAETLPQLHPSGIPGLCTELEALLARQKRRKTVHEPLIRTLSADLEALRSGVPFYSADRYMSLIYKDAATLADYLPADALTIFCDHGNIFRAAQARGKEFGMVLDSYLQSGHLCGALCDFYADWESLCVSLRGKPVVYFDAFLAASYPESIAPKQLLSISCKQLPSYGGNLDTAVEDIRHYQKNRFSTLVLCGNRRRGELLQTMLAERGLSAGMAFPAVALPERGQVFLTAGSLPNGLEYPSIGLAVLTEGQLSAGMPRRTRVVRKKPTRGQKLHSFTDLNPGDLVVHEYHGIGRYIGIEQMRVDGIIKDYIRIAYQGEDTLFIPATQLDLISKYIGGGEAATIRLNKLGGEGWNKTKARAKAAAKDLAGQLILLYAERKHRPGFTFSEDAPWLQEFEDNFEYTETDDQLRCLSEIKQDMETPVPMDRLLCGDVGFGKTEVALRAAMKAILDGKQVAILVPTTVLAQQHFLTATSRFHGFPVNIDLLCRFRQPAEQKKTLEGLRSGSVDLVVGTHKLLQKDVVFKDLGLLIVDEEQRFGVTHKERLKEMSVGVDVLTLSATPIPRTLNMALSGIRDMSTIEEPPQDRYPVQTFVLEHDEQLLDNAMRRELERGGQVYYLHNRVESIGEAAAWIKKRIPEAEVAVAHGKMNEELLGDVMQRMVDGEIGILVCTTIIETGIDIPNVNTLIVENADRMGLSQLHQLRGRVGRTNRHAFAYLTFRRGKVLTEVAEKRLSTIREFAEFGSGFKIAMRDLEIRGAGDLLGAEQSGHMVSVGYDMYLRLLEDAVLEERGELTARPPDCTADLSISANIDKNYVPDAQQRMDLYRRMAAVRSEEDANELLDEIVDRFGEPPTGVTNLIRIALLRANAAQCGILEVRQKEGMLVFSMVGIDLAAISAVCAEPRFRGRIFFSAGDKALLQVRLKPNENSLSTAEFAIQQYRAAHTAPSTLPEM